MGAPYLKVMSNVHYDARVHKARARTIWPWVLCRLKDGDGVASDASLDPWKCSVDHDDDVSEAECAKKLEALKTVGLLVPSEGGGWTTPNWRKHQADPTAVERKRRQRERDTHPEGNGEGVTASRVTDVTSRCHVETRLDETRLDQQQIPDAKASSPLDVPSTGPVSSPPSPVEPEQSTEQQPDPIALDPRPDVEAVAKTARLWTQAEEVHAHWVATMGKTGPAAKRTTAKAKTALSTVRARLTEGYTVEQLKAAVTGCSRSEWHMGANDRGQRYDDLAMICAASKVDRFISGAEGRPGPTRRRVESVNAKWESSAPPSIPPGGIDFDSDPLPF